MILLAKKQNYYNFISLYYKLEMREFDFYAKTNIIYFLILVFNFFQTFYMAIC
jgi:hypothetical protein